MAHRIYDNFFLSNEVEDQFNSHLDLQQFCTVDDTLAGTAGMLRKINRYRATNGTEKLAKGEGNTKSIEVSYASLEYRIQLAQNHFTWYDEEEMTDPMLVPTGARHMGTDMFNTVNADVYGEYKKATKVVPVATFGFNGFVDAQSMLNLENLEDVSIFAFVSPKDVAELRKQLKEDLKYVEAFVKSGYVGTVGGVNIYTKKDATPGLITMATKAAVTIFTKKGTEVKIPPRSAEDENIRKNDMFSRKYYVVALTDERFAVKIVKGTATLTDDTTVTEGTTYYELDGNGYLEVVPETGDDPSENGWYVIA